MTQKRADAHNGKSAEKQSRRFYSDFLPALSNEEYAALEADVAKRGDIVPSTLRLDTDKKLES